MKSTTKRDSVFPEIVYKYRNWESPAHKRMLTDGELWMSSPESFNDPFDCRIPTDFGLLSDLERKKWVDKVAIQQFDRVTANNVNLEYKIRELDRRMQDIATFQKESEEFEFAQIAQFGILSLSSRWDGILMWSHYANNHKGFCIGFHEEKLRNTGAFGRGGQVIYGSKFPPINPLDEDLQKRAFWQTFYKAKDWEYEEEYRLFKADWHNSSPDGSWRKVIVPHDCIAEVVLGLRIQDKHKTEILEFCAAKQIPVFQAKPVAREFSIKREPIV